MARRRVHEAPKGGSNSTVVVVVVVAALVLGGVLVMSQGGGGDRGSEERPTSGEQPSAPHERDEEAWITDQAKQRAAPMIRNLRAQGAPPTDEEAQSIVDMERQIVRKQVADAHRLARVAKAEGYSSEEVRPDHEADRAHGR
jgi:hypothetical protein